MTLAVCSWSLQPRSPDWLASYAVQCEIYAVQLALDPILNGQWTLEDTRQFLREQGISIISAMLQTEGEDYSTLDTIKLTGGLRPDHHWKANLERARKAAPLVRELGASLITFHAGFLPHVPRDPLRAVMLDRLTVVHDIFADAGVETALETGQESADTLRELLEELALPHLGVNFDPANMILYDMGDPVQALTTLAPWVKQIHLKDATRTTTPRQWGTEVPIGSGEVDWARFFEAMRAANLSVDLCIEREAGEDRVGDIRKGLAHLASLGIRP